MLARLGVAGLQVGDIDRRAAASSVSALRLLVVDERDDRAEVGVGQGERPACPCPAGRCGRRDRSCRRGRPRRRASSASDPVRSRRPSRRGRDRKPHCAAKSPRPASIRSRGHCLLGGRSRWRLRGGTGLTSALPGARADDAARYDDPCGTSDGDGEGRRASRHAGMSMPQTSRFMDNARHEQQSPGGRRGDRDEHIASRTVVELSEPAACPGRWTASPISPRRRRGRRMASLIFQASGNSRRGRARPKDARITRRAPSSSTSAQRCRAVCRTNRGPRLSSRSAPSNWDGTIRSASCRPGGALSDLTFPPFRKFLQLPDLFAILSERDVTYRQVFMDGRPLPDDPTPTFNGYSIGRWDGTRWS